MRARFRPDTRGVSEVVGAVLLLGILMLTLSIYQVTAVPNQNAATEFEHNQQVEDEMIDVRNAILEARSSGENTFASVTLGTPYQSRLLTVNPPSPSGTLRTVEQPNINVTETVGETRSDPLGLADRPLENQFIEYSPQYYEYYQAGTMRYENTVMYHEYKDANVFLTDQTLLRGDTVSLVPIEGTIQQNGIGRVAVEPTPGVLETVPVDDPTVTVPTDLSEDEWRELLADELETDDSVSVSDGNLTLSLTGTHDVAYAPIGMNRVPTEGQRGSDEGGINPAAPGDVQLVAAEWSDKTLELTFQNNNDKDSSFTDGRINFYTGAGQIPTAAEYINATTAGENPRGTNWQVGGNFDDLDPNIALEGDGSTTSLDVVFDDTVQENNDFFIITLTLESGQQATYFVGGSFTYDTNTSNGTVAESIEYNGDANSYDDSSGVQFSVANTGGVDATLESISVDTDQVDAEVLYESGETAGPGQHELFVSGTDDGWYEAGEKNNDGYDLGTIVDMTDTATIGAGEDSTFYLTYFQEVVSGNTKARVDVENAELTVVLQFTDGSEKTLTFQN